ncbi:hypothetical protein CBL_08397 [Carabus blaptoides fortunei]
MKIVGVLRIWREQEDLKLRQQELDEDDYDRRSQFCEEMMLKCNTIDGFANRIIFSDEDTFCLNGNVNRHNYRYWSRNNPHWMEETHTQRPQNEEFNRIWFQQDGAPPHYGAVASVAFYQIACVRHICLTWLINTFERNLEETQPDEDDMVVLSDNEDDTLRV